MKVNENRVLKMIWDGYRKQCETVVGAYILTMATIFPFYASNRYFRILRDRTRLFIFATGLMAAIILLITLYFFIRFVRERDNEGLCPFPKVKESKRYLRQKAAAVKLADIFFFLFLVICFVSTILSGHIKESTLGTQGRYQGLLIWLSYGVAYFILRKFFRIGLKSCNIFLCSGLLLSIWGITDYIGLDIFGWLARIQEGQRGSFTSAYGNINTYTAGMSLFLSLSGIGLIHAINRPRKELPYAIVFYVIVFLFSSISMITGQSDNAVIGIAAFFSILPFVAWKTKRGFFGSILLSALFLLSLTVVAVLDKFMKNPYIDPSGGILLRISNKALQKPVFLIINFLFILVAAYGLMHCRRKNQCPGWDNQMPHKCKILTAWGVILAFSICGVTLLLCDANLWHPERYESYAKYLVFNDSWGTHRGFCWRIAMEEYVKFPLWKKLIGSGPETFGIIMKNTHYQEMLTICGQTFDSPHNEALQYLFTTGIAGAVSYYGFLAYGCIKGLLSKNNVKEAAAIAIAVYTAVSFVNISVPITQPYIIILMAVAGREISVSPLT